MEIDYSELSSRIGLMKLKGKLDIVGMGQIETKFAAYCSGDDARIIVDLSGVTFLASIGIRLLTMNAKSMAGRNGKMVLYNPTQEVLRVLEITGIPSIIPVYSNFESAETILLAV